MSPAFQRLNKAICEEYTVNISCDRSRVLDVYEEGELDEVYWTSDFYQRSFTTTPPFLISNLKAGIENVLIHYTQYSTFEECANENFNYSDCSFIVYRHVNKQSNDPSNAELELWKSGEIDLYAQYTHIKVRINSVLIEEDLIRELIESEVV